MDIQKEGTWKEGT